MGWSDQVSRLLQVLTLVRESGASAPIQLFQSDYISNQIRPCLFVQLRLPLIQINWNVGKSGGFSFASANYISIFQNADFSLAVLLRTTPYFWVFLRDCKFFNTIWLPNCIQCQVSFCLCKLNTIRIPESYSVSCLFWPTPNFSKISFADVKSQYNSVSQIVFDIRFLLPMQFF